MGDWALQGVQLRRTLTLMGVDLSHSIHAHPLNTNEI